MELNKKLVLLGIRGLPAEHGGFETFAQYLCRYLVDKGWSVTVYCQEDTAGKVYETTWEGIKRVHIPVPSSSSLSSIIFDWKSIWHARHDKSVHLTLGYNTAVFNLVQRVYGIKNIINMDGIEWKRQKWGKSAKIWFWLNERLGCWFGSHLVADHPEIKEHLSAIISADKITMIPYGAENISHANKSVLAKYDLVANEFCVVIARPEPENSILEIVQSFSKETRNSKLVVLGKFSELNLYHQKVKRAASNEVIFVGAIYDFETVSALRYFSRYYIHGHQVGGTNPSLVEALGAKCAILAHDNKFNRWVAQDAAYYFSETNIDTFWTTEYIDYEITASRKLAASYQYEKHFDWLTILQRYEDLLLSYIE